MKHRNFRHWIMGWMILYIWSMLEVIALQASPSQSEETPVVVVPDHFLRRWDPVTLFFEQAIGPDRAGPEDRPERFVTMSPPHPGAFSWIDRKTLQFQPATPWPPLARFVWRVGEVETTLMTLMEAPLSTVPQARSEGLDPLETIQLTFASPLDPQALKQSVMIEIRPLPGIGKGQAEWMTGKDFEVKTIERASLSDPASFVLMLHHPIPSGMKAILHIRLSLDDEDSASFLEVPFSTAEPFRVTRAGCGDRYYPITPDGVNYSPEQVLECQTHLRGIEIAFSAALPDLDFITARNLIRLTPMVEKLSFEVNDNRLSISGHFSAETLYRLVLQPTDLTDRQGRKLFMQAPSEVYFYFPKKPDYLSWGKGKRGLEHGILEQFGPKMVWLEGRGADRMDLRIYPVEPLDFSFWPFPDEPVYVDESIRPPGPGEAVGVQTKPNRFISPDELAGEIRRLGSPSVSTFVSLPLDRDGNAATFGLDLAPYLTQISGKDAFGTYLVGIRPLDGTNLRFWRRIQVTDLSLSTVEESTSVCFIVTSLSTGKAIAGAKILVQGAKTSDEWVTLTSGLTNDEGFFRWDAPGETQSALRRIVVQYGKDILALDPAHPPEAYRDNLWNVPDDKWLQWTQSPLSQRGAQPETLCHIFTERPVYRPEHPVYIKGYVRRWENGRLSIPKMSGDLVVSGHGEKSWRYPITLTESGSFYHKFVEDQRPTGDYIAYFEDESGHPYGQASFKLEAYRVPRFEVQLHSSDRVPMDREFQVSLSATYYAGGSVTQRPVSWRVTQFPFPWTPEAHEGFLFSSDGRFSRNERFEASTAKLDSDERTDLQGGAKLIINPAIETTAQPRSYIVEATVTGEDDQTVTATRRIVALPPFVLGLKVPRYLPEAKEVKPEIIVVDHNNALLADQEVTVRLLHRQWHSYLQAGDFSEGKARYVTDIVDENVFETKVTSQSVPLSVPMPIKTPGVYIVELEAHDRLKRAQVISVDFYAGGHQPVVWSKPPTRVFTVAADKENYDPGETANIILKNPFSNAQILAIIEAPERNIYEWLEEGSGTFQLPIQSSYVPKIPVHFVLMRGRDTSASPLTPDGMDLGKPETLAATAWINVNPTEHRLNVKLDYPEQAMPGQEVTMEIHLTDVKNNPCEGEVTLWLVDQAVLSLGKEQPLDLLPDFIGQVYTHLMIRDTRSLSMGFLPYAELPGGDGGYGLLKMGSLFDERMTLRRNFEPVPYYNPEILIGPEGNARVVVKLSDDLTNFKIRAKAVSGPDRFGYATGHLSVRLPVLVQPALPRFVRPGDTFTGSAIARAVEGKASPGIVEINIEGGHLTSEKRQDISLIPDHPERIGFPVEIPPSTWTKEGTLSPAEVTFQVAVERASDRARDAFEVKLPLRPDQTFVTQKTLETLSSTQPITLSAPDKAIREGSFRRKIWMTQHPELIQMADALDFLMEYPYGCTEQRVSRSHALLALKHFREFLHLEIPDQTLEQGIRETMEWIASVVDTSGLCAYWPGAKGYVSLTAWVLDFLVDVRLSGFWVDEKLFATLTASLEQALRSDDPRFIEGEAFLERTFALKSLARAGKFNAAYAAQLAQQAQFLDLEGISSVILAFAQADRLSFKAIENLSKRLWDSLIFEQHQGKLIYTGLKEERSHRSGLILPDETRTLASIFRALRKIDPKDPRLPLLLDALLKRGKEGGWGSTNANAQALFALLEQFAPATSSFESLFEMRAKITMAQGKEEKNLTLDAKHPMIHLTQTDPASVTFASQSSKDQPLFVRSEVRYLPKTDGSQAEPTSKGFVVTREMLKIHETDQPLDKIRLEKPGRLIPFSVNDVVEEHIQVVNPQTRHYIAVVVPLSAGMEPLNPHLATAPPQAAPTGVITLKPSYTAFQDDHVAFFYDTLPKGTFDFYFRIQAKTPGRFIQPPAHAEMMYDGTVYGACAGATIVIEQKE